MGGEVILVAVDASKGMSSDYAIEWALQNVTKPEDFLILLALLPSPNSYPSLQSLACYFLSCGKRHSRGSSFNQIDQSERNIFKQTNYAYVHEMQRLCLANNLVQVHYKVKVILNAEMDSIATKAKELKPSWVVLDRHLKKEADQCIKQLNSNVVLIDQAIPRILKAVTPMARQNFSNKLREKDALGVIPYTLDDKSDTSPSTCHIKSSTYSFSLPGTGKYHCKNNSSTTNDSRSSFYLNSEYNFDDSEDFKYQELNQKSAINPFPGRSRKLQ